MMCRMIGVAMRRRRWRSKGDAMRPRQERCGTGRRNVSRQKPSHAEKLCGGEQGIDCDDAIFKHGSIGNLSSNSLTLNFLSPFLCQQASPSSHPYPFQSLLPPHERSRRSLNRSNPPRKAPAPYLRDPASMKVETISVSLVQRGLDFKKETNKLTY